MKPYEHKDAIGHKVTIMPGAPGNALIRVSDGNLAYAEASADQVPAATLALYEAAGLPRPLVLNHPVLVADGRPERLGNITVGRVDQKVMIGLYGIEPEAVDPGAALAVAQLIAGYALQALDGPDPAELDALATTIHAAKCKDGDGCQWMPTVDDRATARAVLLGGWKREPDSDR